MRIRQLLEEPILHFLLIGIALFVVYEKFAVGGTGTISWSRRWPRGREHEARGPEAHDQELEGLVDSMYATRFSTGRGGVGDATTR